MLTISKIREQIVEAQKVWLPGAANPDKPTNQTDIAQSTRAEEALKQSEEFTHIVLENAPNPIIVINSDTSIKYVNPAFEKLTGFSLAELAGKKTPHPWWPEGKKGEIGAALKKTLAGGSTRTEGMFQKKNGELFWVDMNMVPIMHNGALKYHLSNWVDITGRRRAAEALRESEEKFTKAFRSSPDAIAITTIGDGKFIEINDSYTRITGYTREDVIGRSATELGVWVKTEDRARMVQILKERGRVHNEEFDLHLKSGQICTHLFSAELISVGGEPCLISIATDITKRKQAEEALRESEEFSTSLLENAPNPVTVVNPDTSIKYVNPAFERLTGFSLADIAGTRAPYPWWPEDRRQTRLTGLKEFMAGGNAITEQYIQNKSGEHFLVQMNMVRIIHNGVFKYYLAHWNDVTELKKTEEALRESQEKYRDLLDSTNDLIQSVTPDGRFRYVNNGWKQALGYNDSEISNLRLLDIIHPDCLEDYRMLREKMKSGEDIGPVNMTFVSKNGSKIIVEGNVTCKFDNGELLYTRSILRDITKNKYLEEQMFRLSSAVSMSTDCIVITDFDARIIDVNKKTLEIYGADSKGELVGRHFLELIVPAKRAIVNNDVREIMEKGYLECREYHLISKKGREFPVLMSTSIVRAADGKPMGMVRVGRELGKLNQPDVRQKKSEKSQPRPLSIA